MNGRALTLAASASLALAALASRKRTRGGLNRVARVDTSLWIGTTRQNLARILAEGVRPSGGYSVHRTKTKTAVFLAGDPEGALLYADAASGSRASRSNGPTDPVLLEIDAQGLALRPDYDDIGPDIQAYLMDLAEQIGQDVEPGVPLGDLEDAVLDAIEAIEGNRERGGIRGEVEDDGDDRVLVIVPIHDLPVDSRGYRVDPELYDTLAWRDGEPRLETTQYQHLGILPPGRIAAVWTLARGKPVPGRKDRTVSSYGYLVWPSRYEDPEEAVEAGASLAFLKRRFRRYTVAEARRLLRVKP